MALATLGGRPMATRPGQRAAHAAQLFAGALHLVQDAAPMLEQQLAGFGRRRAAAVARQQVLPQLHFEQPHLAAERRLGDVQRDGGAGETAELGDAHEILESASRSMDSEITLR